jgi:hypothetical protein
MVEFEHRDEGQYNGRQVALRPGGDLRRLRTRALTCFPIVALAVTANLACGSTALAQQPDEQPQQDPTWVLSSGVSVTLFPNKDVYPVYMADPHRPTNVLAETFILGGGMPDTDGPLTRLGAGGRFGILRIGPREPEGRAWQVSIEAGLDALFDSRHRLDAAGWDGNYGLTVTTASNSSPLALKLGLLHISAHVGDEYQARTGYDRINYSRDEASVGVAWRWSPRWRVYGEAGAGYRRGDPALEPWRIQSGIEYESGPGPCGRRFACYVAVNVSTMEERNWRVDETVDVGIVIHGVGRTTRIFVEWHDGRPTVNEFFRDSLSSLSLGIKVDL